jgi:hypothetical protein
LRSTSAHAEALGVRRELATHQPLAALAEAGQLANVICLLETLARRPAYVPAALELASGSPLPLVATELPEGRNPDKYDWPDQ